MKKVSLLPLHPFIFVLIPVLTVFNHNFGELWLSMLFLPLAYSFGFGCALFLIYRIFFIRSSHGAGLLTTLTVIYFWLFTNNILFVQLIDPDQTLVTYDRTQYVLQFGLLLFAVFLTSFVVKKTGKLSITVSPILNIFALSLFLIPAIQITYKQIKRVYFSPTLRTVVEFKKDNPPPSVLRDVYYIIIDRYAGFPSLERYFSFDNAEFKEFLENREFFIAENSFANYQYSITSIASSLNMIYLDGIIEESDESFKEATLTSRVKQEELIPLTEIIHNSQIAKYFKSKGYAYYHFGTPWIHTNTSPLADFVYKPRFKTKKASEAILDDLKNNPKNLLGQYLNSDNTIRKTAVSAMSEGWHKHGKINMDQIIAVSKIINAPGPKFVFMHSLLTHDPYVFDSRGKYYDNRITYNDPYDTDADYVEQMKFANSLLMNIVDMILASGDQTPIIILQADEGPYPLKFRKNLLTYDFRTDATYDELFMKFNILNAYLIPDAGNTRIYRQISPVNSFRFILNTYFNEHIPLLPDKVYASKAYLNVLDVTDKLK